MSSYEFMRRHREKFDEKLSKIARNEACGLPRFAGMSSSKVNRGVVGSGLNELPPCLVSEIEAKWKSVIEPVLGFKSYNELRRAML